MMPPVLGTFIILVFVNIGLAGFATYLMFDQLVQMVHSTNLVIYGNGAVFLVMLILALLAAYGRQNWARWVFSIVNVVVIIFAFPQVMHDLPKFLLTVVNFAQIFLEIMMIGCLFTSASQDWFRRRHR